MPIDFQPIQDSVPQASSGKIDFQEMAPEAAASATPTSTPSKLLAGATGLVQGGLTGAGQILEAPANFATDVAEKGLNILADHGIVSKDLASRYSAARADINKGQAELGQKVLDFQGKVGAEDMTKNPNISKYSNIAGNAIASSVIAGKLVGNLGAGMATVPGMALNQGAQGLLMGAAANQQNPIKGAAIGGAIGGVLGGIAGHFSKSADIIAEKQAQAAALNQGPYSEGAIRSTKEALDNSGKEMLLEQNQVNTAKALHKTLDNTVTGKVDINQNPQDIITNMATKNFSKVKAEKDALYQPLNESTVPAETPTLNTILSGLKNKKAINNLPDSLQPNGNTIQDLMTYRKQVGAAARQAEKALNMGHPEADIKTLEELNSVKAAVTKDLNSAASTVGLGDQLKKADSFYQNNYSPFKVYDTTSGKLKSEQDIRETWDKVSALLKPKKPNTDAMANVAKTLGPEGKTVFGYAYLKAAANRAMEIDGRINPSKVSAELNKLTNSGLADKILTPELQDAFKGMRVLAEAGQKQAKLSGNNPLKEGIAGKVLNWMTHTSGGITVLKLLGSKSTPLHKAKNAAAQILLNYEEQQAARNSSKEGQ